MAGEEGERGRRGGQSRGRGREVWMRGGGYVAGDKLRNNIIDFY